ncbi:MAG: permease [Candidatus Aminicenantes bacterium RBG_13_63_10]|nr:MAG: permease [Candidatus Aminicenantes bacterium RBG_13_63_10]
MFVIVIWILAAVLLFLSFLKDKQKTAGSLLAAWKFFRSMALPVLLTLWAIGFLLTFLTPGVITGVVGEGSGWRGVVLAAVFGSIALIQAFIAFPLAGSLLRQGASVSAIAAFVTTLVMVGIVTAPLESKYFGRRFTFWRNTLSFVFAVLIALIMGAWLG